MKNLLLMALALAFAAVVTGCNQNGSTPSTDTTASTNAPAVTATNK